MHIFPTEAEVRLSADLLVNTYKVSAQLLGQLFDTERRDQANAILQSFGASRLTALDVALLLVQRDGPVLFAGSRESVRELRLHLLRQLPDEEVRRLFDRHAPGGTSISSPSHMRKPLADKKWHSGKHWPRDFVGALGFPDVLAGAADGERVPTVYDVPPLKNPPKLADFQLGLKAGMLQVLARDGDKTRCVVTLPTGGGKTRIAVEAFIDWMQPRFEAGKYLLWIAQSEELCEQAIACIDQIWGSREFVGQLRIYRFFGGRELSADDLHGGAVVASIQQLHNRAKSRDAALEAILKGCNRRSAWLSWRRGEFG